MTLETLFSLVNLNQKFLLIVFVLAGGLYDGSFYGCGLPTILFVDAICSQ